MNKDPFCLKIAEALVKAANHLNRESAAPETRMSFWSGWLTQDETAEIASAIILAEKYLREGE